MVWKRRCRKSAVRKWQRFYKHTMVWFYELLKILKFITTKYHFYRELYSVALENDASCVEALYNLGLCNKKLGMYEDALEVFFKLQTIVRNHSQVIIGVMSLIKNRKNPDYNLYLIKLYTILFLGSLSDCQSLWATWGYRSSNRMVSTIARLDTFWSCYFAKDGSSVWQRRRQATSLSVSFWLIQILSIEFR